MLCRAPQDLRLETRISRHDYTSVHTSAAQLLHTRLPNQHRSGTASLQPVPSPPVPHQPLQDLRAGKQQLPGQSLAPLSPHGAEGVPPPSASTREPAELPLQDPKGQICQCKLAPRHSPMTRWQVNEWVGAAQVPRDHLKWPQHLVSWALSPAGHFQAQITALWSQVWQPQGLQLMSPCPSPPCRLWLVQAPALAVPGEPQPEGVWVFPTRARLCLQSSRTSRHQLSPHPLPSNTPIPPSFRRDNSPGKGTGSQSPNSQSP